MKKELLLSVGLALWGGDVWAQTPMQVVPGSQTTSGCPGSITPCWLPNSQTNPLYVSSSGSSSITGTVAQGAGASSGGTNWLTQDLLAEAGIGNPGDAAWTTGNGSAVAVLKAVDRDVIAGFAAPLPAGTSIIGTAASTVANGADVALGSTTDTASAGATATLLSVGKQLHADLIASLPAGSATIGAVTGPGAVALATSANQTNVESNAGTSSATALTVQGNASGVAMPVSGTVVATGAAAAALALDSHLTNVQSSAGTSATTLLGIQGGGASALSVGVTASNNAADGGTIQQSTMVGCSASSTLNLTFTTAKQYAIPCTTNAAVRINANAPFWSNDTGSGTISTTTTSSAFAAQSGPTYEFQEIVTSVTGTNTTFDVEVQEQLIGSSGAWVPVYDFPRCTAACSLHSPPIPVRGYDFRYVQTLGGTGSPTAVRALSHQEISNPAKDFMQMIDRTIVLTSAASTTATLQTDGASNFSWMANNVATPSTTTVLFQCTNDNGTNWSSVGTAQALAAGSAVYTVSNVSCQAVELKVSAAGTGTTYGNFTVDAWGP